MVIRDIEKQISVMQLHISGVVQNRSLSLLFTIIIIIIEARPFKVNSYKHTECECLTQCPVATMKTQPEPQPTIYITSMRTLHTMSSILTFSAFNVTACTANHSCLRSHIAKSTCTIVVGIKNSTAHNPGHQSTRVRSIAQAVGGCMNGGLGG